MNNIKFKGASLAKLSFVGAVAFSFMCSSITSVNAGHHGNVYGPYPITEKSYKGTKRIPSHMAAKWPDNYYITV